MIVWIGGKCIYIYMNRGRRIYVPKCDMCTYTCDYVHCDVTDYIAITSYITYIIAVLLRVIITGWNIMLGCDYYTKSHHYILVEVVVITPHSITKVLAVDHIVMICWHNVHWYSSVVLQYKSHSLCLSDTVPFILPFYNHILMWYISISRCESSVIFCFIACTFMWKERSVTCKTWYRNGWMDFH